MKIYNRDKYVNISEDINRDKYVNITEDINRDTCQDMHVYIRKEIKERK